MKTPIIERRYSSAGASALLARMLGDNRDYCHLLTDQRRGRRANRIPFDKDKRGRVFYYESDLLRFVDLERKRGVEPEPAYTVVEHEDRLMTPHEALRIAEARTC